MPIYILTLFISVICVVHIVKTGRPFWWIYIVVFLPVAGSIAYLIVEVLPSMRSGGQRVVSKIGKVIDPQRDLKRHAEELEIADTAENTIRLAEECLRTGHAEKAVALYEARLGGVHANDPKLLLGLAQAHFQLQRYQQAREVLDRLIETSPNFKSPEGHLLYARALEELGDTDAAFEEYAVLAGYYPGVEARCRYALLLEARGETEKARELYNDIVLSAKRFRQFYKGDNKVWVERARERLSQLTH